MYDPIGFFGTVMPMRFSSMMVLEHLGNFVAVRLLFEKKFRKFLQIRFFRHFQERKSLVTLK